MLLWHHFRSHLFQILNLLRNSNTTRCTVLLEVGEKMASTTRHRGPLIFVVLFIALVLSIYKLSASHELSSARIIQSGQSNAAIRRNDQQHTLNVLSSKTCSQSNLTARSSIPFGRSLHLQSRQVDHGDLLSEEEAQAFECQGELLLRLMRLNREEAEEEGHLALIDTEWQVYEQLAENGWRAITSDDLRSGVLQNAGLWRFLQGLGVGTGSNEMVLWQHPVSIDIG